VRAEGAAEVADLIGDITLERVQLYELPLELLQQKPGWNAKAFLAWAIQQPEWAAAAFVAYEDGAPVACWLFTGNAVYSVVVIDTFIVDAAFRTHDRVKLLVKLAYKTAERAAQDLGFERVSWSSHPKLAARFIEYLKDEGAEIGEHVVVVRVNGERR
jgi:hypothetical protein